MADDGSPPPPLPSSPPPSFAGEEETSSNPRSSFKSLQQMLAKSNTMYTSTRPAPPPLAMPPPPPTEDNSPTLEHRTRQRPRRKTRAPSRTALREKASSSTDPFEMAIKVQDELGAPPPISGVPVEPSEEPSLPPPPDLPPASPSPPPSPPLPPPSPPPPLLHSLSSSSSPSKPHLIQTNHDSISPFLPDQPATPQPATKDQPETSMTTFSDVTELEKYRKPGVKAVGETAPLAAGMIPKQSKPAAYQRQPLISVVPYKATDRSSTGVQSSSATSTFTNRLKQIRERRAAQRRSPSPSAPSPSALSPTHSASSLPQYLGPLTESASEDTAGPSSVPLSSLSVSPVTSQASLDSSVLRDGSTDPYSSPSVQEVSAGVQTMPVVDGVKAKMESSDSSNPPSLPPSPPPSPPPSLPPPLPPTLSLASSTTVPPSTDLTVHTSGHSLPQSSDDVGEGTGILGVSRTTDPTTVTHKETDGISVDSQTYKSLESLSNSSDSAPELPSEPPPSTPLTTEPVKQPFPLTGTKTASPVAKRSPLLRDIGRTTRISSEISASPTTSSSTPKLTSGPVVQLRRPQSQLQGYQPEHRSAFEAMIISESSSENREGEKRFSVAERRALTLQASRRPDAASDPVRKRWSHTENIFTTGESEEEVQRTRSALAKLGISPECRGIQTKQTQEIISNFSPSKSPMSNSEEFSTGSQQTAKSSKFTKESVGASKATDDTQTSTLEKGDQTINHVPPDVVCHLQDVVPANSPELKIKEDRDSHVELAETPEDKETELNPPRHMLPTASHRNQFTVGETEITEGRESDQESWDHPDELEVDPSSWSVDDVCEWLELVGLGTYRDTFREHGVDGSTLLNMDVQIFIELGVDSAEIRELFLSKIYELSHPTQNTESMQDDFCLEVDSYTEQDWRKLEAAIDALKSPVLRDDIELDPSAIGQFLHTDYVLSHSTPNIHQLQQQLDEPLLDQDAASINDHLPTSVPHSSTVHSFPESNPIREQTAVTDQIRRKTTRAPSTRSIQRHYILTMAEAGDKPRRGHSASSQTTYPSSSVSSQQGSPSISSHNSTTELPTSPQRKGAASTSRSGGEGKKKKRRRTAEGDIQKPSVQNYSQTLVSKDLDQGVIVHKQGRYHKMRLGSFLRQTSREPPTDNTTALIRLFMNHVQEGLHYKAFLVGVRTTAEELVAQALERSHITDNPLHFSIWQVAGNNRDQDRELAGSECPLALQLEWPQLNTFHFQLKLKKEIERIQLQLDLPLCSKTDVRLSLPMSATTAEAVQSILESLDLAETYSQRGVHCALMDVTSRSRPERALAEKECPVSLVKTGHKLKLVSISVNKRSSSSGQSDMPALMARLHQLEQDKTILTEQLQSAQSMMRTYMESGTPSPLPSLSTITEPLESKLSDDKSGEGVDGAEDDNQEAGEVVIGRLKLLNRTLNDQLEQQRMNISQLTREKQKLEKNVLELTNRDKEMVLEMGVLQVTLKDVQQQLTDSENSRAQLQQSLEVIGRNRPNNDDGAMESLQERLRRAEQEISRLNSTHRVQAAKLQAAEQQRLKAVHTVRRLVVQSGRENSMAEEEEEEESSEPAGMYKSGKAELVKACRQANRELRKHRLYLDQLLAIVVDRHPEILTLVAEAQNMRDLVDSDSWC